MRSERRRKFSRDAVPINVEPIFTGSGEIILDSEGIGKSPCIVASGEFPELCEAVQLFRNSVRLLQLIAETCVSFGNFKK